jgi:hypothetical protein
MRLIGVIGLLSGLASMFYLGSQECHDVACASNAIMGEAISAVVMAVSGVAIAEG